jgi:hypothetical protein
VKDGFEAQPGLEPMGRNLPEGMDFVRDFRRVFGKAEARIKMTDEFTLATCVPEPLQWGRILIAPAMSASQRGTT